RRLPTTRSGRDERAGTTSSPYEPGSRTIVPPDALRAATAAANCASLPTYVAAWAATTTEATRVASELNEPLRAEAGRARSAHRRARAGGRGGRLRVRGRRSARSRDRARSPPSSRHG